MDKMMLKNAIYKVLLNAFNLLVPLFVGPYIAGLLDPEFYGIYNRVYAEFQIFLIVGAFGIYYYGVREISKVRNDPEKFSGIFTSLFVIGVLSNLIVTVVYIIYFMVRGDGVDRFVYAVMIIQMVSNVFYIEFVNEAVENYRFIAVKTILIRIAYLVSVFLFVRKADDVIIYSVVVSITVLLNNLASYFYLKRQFKFNFRNIRLLCHIFPLFVNLLFVNVELLYSQLDKVLLGYFVSDIAVTEYTLPTTLSGMISSLPLALITVAIPRFSGYIGSGNRERYMNELKSTCRTYMAILVPINFGILVLSREIMWLYSQDVYTYIYPVLIAAALSRIVYGYQSMTTYLLMYVNGMEKKLTLFLFYGGIVNIALNFLLIALRIFTPITSIITTVISVLVFVFIANSYVKKHLGISGVLFSKEIRRYCYVGALFIPIAYVVNLLGLGYIWNIVLDIVLCVGVYGAYMLITKDPITEAVFAKLPKKNK